MSFDGILITSSIEQIIGDVSPLNSYFFADWIQFHFQILTRDLT